MTLIENIAAVSAVPAQGFAGPGAK